MLMTSFGCKRQGHAIAWSFRAFPATRNVYLLVKNTCAGSLTFNQDLKDSIMPSYKVNRNKFAVILEIDPVAPNVFAKRIRPTN
jgi:hypothetical protein